MWLFSLLTSLAAAQSPGDFVVQGSAVDGDDVPWGIGGVGSPSLAWDRGRSLLISDYDVFFMFFETQTGDATASCPVGQWGIGLAYSLDSGATWEVMPNPVVTPTAGTYYSCVAAHPTAVDITPGLMLVYFKSEQGPDACDQFTPSWGCDQYTGLGRFALVRSVLDSDLYEATDPDPVPVLSDVLGGSNDLGYPKVMFDDGEYRIAMQQRPDIYLASGPFSDDITLNASPTLQPGWQYYANGEAFNPAVVCEADGSIRAFIGGRRTAGNMLVDNGFSTFTTSSWLLWVLDQGPFFSLAGGAAELRHWDVLRFGNDYFMAYSDPSGPGGLNQVQVAHTAPPTGLPASKVCP